jgi:uncharacterized membrane protein/peroxiredoxin
MTRAGVEDGRPAGVSPVLDRTFKVGLVLKAADGVLEIVAGGAACVHQPERHRAARSHGHRSRSPHDRLANYILHTTAHLGSGTTLFGATYLLSHGISKVILVALVLRNRLWAYPWLMGLLAVFIGYQLYVMVSVTFSWGLAALTAFDVLLVWLTWREYQARRASGLPRPWTLAPRSPGESSMRFQIGGVCTLADMAVSSLMVPLGTLAPDFALPDLAGTTVRRDDFAAAPALLVVFVCNHCPYVRHIEAELSKVLAQCPSLAVVGICTNDIDAYPDDRPERLAEQAQRAGWVFPYLLDHDQQVGRAYNAACTPDFFLYDRQRRLAYRGAFDESTPGNGKPVTGDLLRAAVEQVLAGKPVPEPHRPSMGCSIKWRT